MDELDPNAILQLHGPEALRKHFDAAATPPEIEPGRLGDENAFDLKAQRSAERKYIAKLGFDIRTQNGNAQLFAERFAARWRYCHASGKWYEWDGTRWRIDGGQRAFQAIRELCVAQAKELGPGLRATLESTGFVHGVEVFARGEPALSVENAEFWDRDPFLLGTPGGTVDLRTSELQPAQPVDGITKLTAIAPAEIPDCPQWMAFLHEATGGDKEMVRFLQQWLGYCLTADTREHALLFIYGPGGNGKSVFVNLAAWVLSEYNVNAPMDAFTASYGDRHPTELAMLKGARMVTASETEEGRAWAAARIKQLTGGDPISARFMREDFFTFRPQFKLTFVGNHKPALNNVDEAMKRRFVIVPFTRKPARPDKQLEEKLRAEAPKILRWMIEGCLDWQRNGLMRPRSVLEATSSYFEDQDLQGQWIEEKCDADPDNPYKWEFVARLYTSWKEYAESAGERPGTVKSFSENLKRRGFQPKRTSAGRGFSGLCLKSERKDYEPDL